MDDDAGPGRMRPNPYVREPLQVTFYSVLARRPTRSAVFLGGAPAGVVAAARRGTPSRGGDDAKRWPKTDWTERDAKVLADFYGPRWRQTLTPAVCDLYGASVDGGGEGGASVEGGDDGDDAAAPGMDFGRLDTLNELNELDEEESIVLHRTEPAAQSAAQAQGFGAPAEDAAQFSETTFATLYSDSAVFPDDTISDLRAKISLATGVPTYRMHLFWPRCGIGREQRASVEGAYRLYVAGVQRAVDVRAFGSDEGLHIDGLSVDQSLSAASSRGEVFVEALDEFRLVGGGEGGAGPSAMLTRVFVADLEEMRRGAPGAQDTARARKIAAAMRDPMKAEYVYNGLVLKYWPQLSQAACAQYFAGAAPSDLAAQFPALAGPADARARYRAQDRLLSAAHARAESVYRRHASARAVAVTSAAVEVPSALPPGAYVNLRNAFDLFETSARWPAVLARFYLTAAGRGRQTVTATKTHTSAAPGGNADADEIARLLGRVPRRRTATFFVRLEPADEGAWSRGRARLVTLVLRDTGDYSLEASWPEDERLSPAAAVARLADVVAPLVAAVNAMGAYAFPAGGELALPDGAARLKNMTAACFWAQPLTDAAFRELKSRWRAYEQAGMAEVRGLQQAGAFAFQYTKGVVDYDPRAVERTVTVTMVGHGGHRRAVRELAERTMNTYAHLTNPEVAQRWAQLYGGRLVRFQHRTVDVRVEFVGVTGEELRRMWGVTFAFFDGLVHGPDRVSGAVAPGAAGATRRKGLRALQEGDPSLYDLRKYDSRATVYSVLCQNPRPPSAYTPDEADAMPAKRRDKLVRYWNFTEGRPAYYECPTREFPHLSFLEGRHPLGYCLPCCQKTPAHGGSRRERINRFCLEAFAEGDAGADGRPDDEGGSSRHTLSYGKRIEAGRLATLDELTLQLIASSDEEGAAGYRLLGVPQGLPALPPDAPLRVGRPPGGGFFHALAAAVGVEPETFGGELARTAARLGDGFRALAAGAAGGLFGSAQELAAELSDTFASGGDAAPAFTAFSPGGAAHGVWEDVVRELACVRYDVSVVYVLDPAGSGEGALHVPPDTLARLAHGAPGRYAVVYMVGHPEAKRGGGGVYPLVDAAASGAFAAGSAVVEAVRGAVGGGGRGRWDLAALAAHLRGRAGRGFRAVSKLVGSRGLCYAAVVERVSDGARVCVPVEYSVQYPSDPLDVEVAEAAEAPGAASALAEFVGTLPDSRFQAVCALRHASRYVGVGLRCGDTGVLYFYHRPTGKPAAVRGAFGGAKLPEVDLPLMPADVDRAVAGGRVPVEVPADAREEFYRANLYQHFLSEFAAHVYALRDAGLRLRLLDAMSQKRPLAAAREVLVAAREVLVGARDGEGDGRDGDLRDAADRDVDDDLELVAAAVARIPPRAPPAARKKTLADFLDGVSLGADRKVLARIGAADEARAADIVRGIMDGLVSKRPRAEVLARVRADDAPLPSMFAACAAAHACAALEVPEEDYPGLVSVLVADVRNPLKLAVLPYQTSGVFDDLHFRRRPGESVEIRL